MKALVLLAIRGYQRYLSPRKGYCCAYAAYTGHASCSALGYRTIRRFGVVKGVVLLDRRLHKCGVANRRYRPAAPMALGNQGGFVDCDCGAPGCDSPGCDMPGCGDVASNCPSVSDKCEGACDCAGNVFDGLPDSCDRRRQDQGEEQYVVIPPRGGLRRR